MNESAIVVVGHVNQGKSSVVATLAADDTIDIGPIPGLTRMNRAFTVPGAISLVDTPGFQQPKQVLAWLKASQTAMPDRPQRLRDFVEYHRKNGQFEPECELLGPILDSGTILYVVDASEPYLPEFEPEFEILSWSARPRIALINNVGAEDYSEQWNKVLPQWFGTVRRFNAQKATFQDRLDLLTAFGALDGKHVWHAATALQEDRRRKCDMSATEIANMLVNAVTIKCSSTVKKGVDHAAIKSRLTAKYQRQMAMRERVAWDAFGRIYEFKRLWIVGAAGDNEFGDGSIFSEQTRAIFGPTRWQFTNLLGGVGASLGLMVDASTLGHSLGLPTLCGTATGYAAAWFLWNKAISVNMIGTQLSIGPLYNPQYHWILLDRAMRVQKHLALRAHARRDEIEVTTLEEVDVDQQRLAVAKILAQLVSSTFAVFDSTSS